MRPRLLFLAGAVLLVTAAILALVLRPGPKQSAPPPPTTTSAPPPTSTTAPPPPTTTAPPPPPPPRVAMSWSNAGAIVVHTHDVDPTWLGQQLHAAGFGWAAVFLGTTGTPNAVDPEWVTRFIMASGLPVGGWTTLEGNAQSDAAFAVSQLKANGLSFYIADAENPYQDKGGASQQFVTAFRKLEPTMTAALSSFCDAQGIGLASWAAAGFAFLPQAYVNDFGAGVSPAACVRASTAYFPLSAIHPTVGSYHGQRGWVSAQRYTRLLSEAGTTGFSVYPAETQMDSDSWQAYGQAIRTLHIAGRAG